MLEMNPETVCFLISKSREFHAKEQVVIPEVPENPSGDWGTQVLADHSDDMTLQEFTSSFADLEPDQQETVLALFWLGRGDFELEEWDQALEQANSYWVNDTADYLIAHPLLADYLMEGLSLHEYDCE